MKQMTNTVDLNKIKLYNEWLYASHIYDEGDSQFHKELTAQVITQYIDPLNLDKDSKILDLGCGPDYFLDEMKARSYTNLVGVTLSAGDIALCESKGHTIKQDDLSFLPHPHEHSPYPVFSLMEYNAQAFKLTCSTLLNLI